MVYLSHNNFLVATERSIHPVIVDKSVYYTRAHSTTTICVCVCACECACLCVCVCVYVRVHSFSQVQDGGKFIDGLSGIVGIVVCGSLCPTTALIGLMAYCDIMDDIPKQRGSHHMVGLRPHMVGLRHHMGLRRYR